MKCPGQDSRFWGPEAIFEADCPECGASVEFFKDESSRRCRRCGCKVLNPRMDFGCALYCRFAEECLGEALTSELAAKRADLLKELEGSAPNFKDKGSSNGKAWRKPMAKTRKIVEIDEKLCDGCGLCALACAEGALEIVDGKARIISDTYCDGLGACLSGCPTGAVRIIEREADEFDEKAVEEHLAKAASRKEEHAAPEAHGESPAQCGCPSSRVQVFPSAPMHANAADSRQPSGGSELSNWPIQIKLVPPTAPFLKRAHLLVVSDCAPVAYPDFHRDFVKGKAVLMGCPKLDDKQEYAAKFTEIFRTADIQSVTVIEMEVPCCSAMPTIVRNAMKMAGKDIPIEEVIISVRGSILKRGENAA